MTIDELAFRTGVRDLKTLRAACKDLARDEIGLLVTQTGRHGKETWMPAGMLLPEFRQAYFPERGKSPIYLDVGEIQNGGNPLAEGKIPVLEVENHPKNVPERGNPPLCAGSDLTESISIINQSDENLNQKFPTPEIILGAATILFGDTLEMRDIPKDIKPELLLTWIIKAYEDRKRLTKPLGVLRARLKAHSPRSLPKDWRERLPGEYLDEIGVKRPATLIGEREDPPEEDPPEAAEETAMVDPNIADGWDRAVESQRFSMTGNAFDRLYYAKPSAWNPESGELVLLTRDQQDADWLDSRMTRTMERLLVGIYNRAEVSVRFVAR